MKKKRALALRAQDTVQQTFLNIVTWRRCYKNQAVIKKRLPQIPNSRPHLYPSQT